MVSEIRRSDLASITLLILALLPACSEVPSATPTPALAVAGAWTASSLVRIGETDPPQRAPALEIRAARGETESFQIAIHASQAGLVNVNVTFTDLTGPSHSTIPKSAFALYREHYVTVSKSSPDLGGANRPLGPGRYADALIPFVDPETGRPPAPARLRAVPFSVAPNTNQPIWVDVVVPREAAAGTYSGHFTVTSDRLSVTQTVTLQVWNFTLPARPALRSFFPYGNGDSGTPAQNRELLRHRLGPAFVPPADQRAMIDTLGLGQRSLLYWGGDCKSMGPPPSVDAIREKMALQEPDLYVYNYSVDDILGCKDIYNDIVAWAKNLHAAGVDQLITVPPITELSDDGTGSGRSAVDIWTMVPSHFESHAASIAKALAKGDRVWSYNALVLDSYSPKWQMDYPPPNWRLQPGFLNAKMRATGLLYWKVDRWSQDPWNDVNNTGAFAADKNYPGEGMLVYPGADAGLVGVAPSMRLKWLRDGVDDFDYIQMLRDAGLGDWAEGVGDGIARDWRRWSRDPIAIENARRQLGEQLDRLGYGTR